MFNVKRIGSTVEITQIPREVSIEVFKDISEQTKANECLICFSMGSDTYEVIIRHENDNMAGAVAWLVLNSLGDKSKIGHKENHSTSAFKGFHIETLNYYVGGIEITEPPFDLSRGADKKYIA